MDQITIRAAAGTDAALIAALLGQLGYPATGDQVEARLARLRPDDNALLIALASPDRAVGLVGLHKMPVIHADAPTGYITAFVVDEGLRGHGVGRLLLRAAESWARARGCHRLTVTSAEHRAGAHAFYPRCGLPYTGRRYAKTLD